MRNPSRTPSPMTSPFLVPHLQKQQQALQDEVKSNVGVVAPVPVPPAQYSTILKPQQPSQSTTTSAATDIQPTTMANGSAASYDFASRRRRGKRQLKSAPGEVVGEEAGDSTSTNDTGNEIFYTDDEDDEAKNSPAAPILNGHAVGYTGSSDLSHSTTSTAAVVHRLPPTTASPTSQPTTTTTTTLVARRRKSVRVSLQPTFSPSPPAVEYDDKEEQPWEWKQDHHHTAEGRGGGGGGGGQLLRLHAPVPVAAGSSSLLTTVHHRQKVVAAPEPSARAYDIWEDSDEDVEYQNAKLLLTRAAKNEKDMQVFAARSTRH
jgi:hypothetical protein